MKKTNGEMKEPCFDRIFNVINVTLLVIICLVVLYPLWFTIIASVSNPYAVSTGKVILWPVDFSLDAYSNMLRNQYIATGFINSFLNAGILTLYSLILTIPCGYALSRKGIKGKNVIMTYFIITMYFGGGLIPSYILIRNLGLVNTRWALIIPAGFSVYNMILVRTYFQTSISEELYEAANIDGASEFRVFISIALPLSGAIIAVIALYVAVGSWNNYFNALLYINEKKLLPIQNVLRNVLNGSMDVSSIDMSSMSEEEIDAVLKQSLMQQAMKYSLILISSLPMIVIYPFVQRFFVKGVMIGAVKG